VEAPAAVYYRSECGGFGPRDYAYYPFHGIFVSVKVWPLQLGLHYPPGTTVTLDDDRVTISGMRQNEPVEIVQHLVPAAHGALGNDTPGEFCAMNDPLGSGNGGYHCPASGPQLTWAYFIRHDLKSTSPNVRLPSDLRGARITIPAMTINGEKYESQELSIVDAEFVGVEPLNC